MKNFKFIATLIIPIFLIGFLSCEKEDVQTIDSTITQNPDNLLNVKANERVFYDYGDEGAECKNSGGSCAPRDVVITPQQDIISFNNVFDTVFKGDDEAIIKVFEEEERVLKAYLDDNIIDGVIAGKLLVEARRHIDNDDTRFLIFKEKDKIIEVDPIVCIEE